MFMLHKDSGIVYCRKGYAGSKCDERCGPGAFGHDCSLVCDCGERLCEAASGRCLTEEEEAAEKIDWAAILAQGQPITRRKRRARLFY